MVSSCLAERGYDIEAGVTVRQAAAVFELPVAVVGMWAARGWRDKDGEKREVRVVGKNRRGRLYRFGDLADAELDTADNPRRHSRRRRDDFV